MTDVTAPQAVASATLHAVTESALATAARARRYQRIEWIIVACTAAIIIVALGVGLFFGARQNEIRNLIRQQQCVAQVTAHFQGAVAAALAAPPAPNAERTEAVSEINRAATMLRHLDRQCPA